ncbi:MAG: methylated-DNA--protein-cysteine methyltransferase [Bacteroidetes bacterium OLB9]|nr:MAG: methylated-DNA--protein-cysteine methyltransferase [Bacteroidetes bacterium OLB9]MCZ2338560.1 methylated-DNA--[protein]-cysteine S-methyltransferase [Chitinophagales bacterium]
MRNGCVYFHFPALQIEEMKPSALLRLKDLSDEDYFQEVDSPMGKWVVGAGNKGIKWLKIVKDKAFTDRPNAITRKAVEQLDRYFTGDLHDFNLPLELDGYTNFSLRVWHELIKIPYGNTISYKTLAIRLGDVKCIRAAARANGSNPIPIIIPCHRVIGSDGSLTGYALGLDVKKYLLELENPTRFSTNQMILFD